MKSIKIFISLFLVFTMFTVSLPSLGIFALTDRGNESVLPKENAYTSSGICGENVSWSLDENGTLTVYGNGEMYDYTKNNSVFYSFRNNIKKVVFEDGVTSVGDYAFYSFTGITSVTFAPSVNEIGRYAFNGCTSVNAVYISDMAAWCTMDNCYNGDSPLYYSHKLFLNNELVTDLVIPEGVEKLSVNAFSNCTALESITIPKSLKYISAVAFYNCTNLKAIYISDMDAWLQIEYRASQSNPLYFAHDLYLNNELVTDIVIPTGTEKINDYAFIGSSAKSLCIGGSVKSIGKQAFYNCTELCEITLPGSVEYISEEVFLNTAYYDNSSNWENGVLYIGNHLIKAVETLSGHCDIKVGTKTVAAEAFLWCDITTVTIPEGVILLGREAFSCCEKLSNVTIPESITKIGESSFNCCTSMYLVNLPSTLKEIGAGAFSFCTSLKSIDFPDSLETIGGEAFIECYNLYSFKIGSNVKKIGWDAFMGTSYFNYNDNWSDDCLYHGDWLLNSGYKTRSVTVKEGTKHIADGVFYGKAIDDIELPLSLESIGARAFEYSSITGIKLPENISIIGSNAFASCHMLEQAELNKKIAEIPDYAFAYCGELKEVILNSAVTSIGEYAFRTCSSLEKLYIPDNVTNIADNAFFDTPLLTISCSKGSYAERYATENDIPYSYICDIHSFTNYISNNDGDCYNDSTMTAFCDNGCGVWNTITKENSKCHSYEYSIIREATCLKNGLVLNKCTVCGDYYSESIPKSDHLYSTYTSNNDATCTENGTKTSYCVYNCGSSITIEAEKSALGHKYSNYIYNNDATCTKDGTKTAVCANGCGISNTITASKTKLSHRFSSYEYNNDATCTEDGTKSAYCDYNCGTLNTVRASGTKLGHSYIVDIIEPPTCTETGTVLYMCSVCFEYITEEMAAAHSMGEWAVIKEATPSSEGESIRCCCLCDYFETDIIPILLDPEITLDGYNVQISKVDRIKYIRYAKGEYSTASEIKNAEGCVTLDSTAIYLMTKDNTVNIKMTDGGVYTIWVKYYDSFEGIYTADLSVMEQRVEAKGVSLTVKNLYGVKDYFIAKGEYTNYKELRANAIVQVTKNKFGSAHDYTYILLEPGRYTVYIRYDDAQRDDKIIYTDLVVTEPEFFGNGLQLTVKNLEDIKVIRTAYGNYSSPGDIKRAQGNRAFSGKTLLKGLVEYTVQYREEGIISIAVVYNNGYEVVYKYNVIKKKPLVTKQGNTVTISDLDDFKVIRYASGEYTTSNQIKNAKGSVTVSSKYYSDDNYTVTLSPGTYTFCVQYNDESYNYFVLNI
ncbi:MAG: leucine-rich repeat domain-containing protein [Clostridia bacterium]|nr:leucine-rich repeat domain-containing protein [Clostridia bacterium]